MPATTIIRFCVLFKWLQSYFCFIQLSLRVKIHEQRRHCFFPRRCTWWPFIKTAQHLNALLESAILNVPLVIFSLVIPQVWKMRQQKQCFDSWTERSEWLMMMRMQPWDLLGQVDIIAELERSPVAYLLNRTTGLATQNGKIIRNHLLPPKYTKGCVWVCTSTQLQV